MAGYAHAPPFASGLLRVTGSHQIHHSQYGSPQGLPALFLHGGPGGHTRPRDARFFDPTVYRVILFDQRGTGQSLPKGSLEHNTTHDLLADIEALRGHLEVPKWHIVFGGSWGSTLALLYAQAHSERVGSLVLRGVFTAREFEFTFARGENGAAHLFPDKYEEFLRFLPDGERKEPYAAYHQRLMSDNETVARAAAREWNRWGITIASVRPGPDAFQALDNESYNLVHARLESQYFTHRAWLPEGHILEDRNMAKIRHIPGE